MAEHMHESVSDAKRWAANEWTPAMSEIREDYAATSDGDEEVESARQSAFKRAIAAHDRAVKAKALREAADLRHGTDLTPTIMGNPDPFWWYEYLQRLDEAWRHQLRARAEQIEGGAE